MTRAMKSLTASGTIAKMGILNALRRRLSGRNGFSDLITGILIVVVVATLFCGTIAIFGQASRIDDLQQIAQLMAREISLTGALNTKVSDRLSDLEDLFRMDVELDVEGDFIGNSDKLKLESHFTVTVSYKTKYGVGGIINFKEEETYVARAAGIVEEYHKTD